MTRFHELEQAGSVMPLAATQYCISDHPNDVSPRVWCTQDGSEQKHAEGSVSELKPFTEM